MSVLHSLEIKPFLTSELKNTKKDLMVISAFVKIDALMFIDECLGNTLPLPNKKLLVRFRLEDLLSGSTDIEIFNYCRKNNWKLFVNFDLHSKIIVFDRNKILLGSANITSSGIGLTNKQNIESVVTLNIDEQEYEKIKALFLDSVKLNDELYNRMEQEFLSFVNDKPHKRFSWSSELESFFCEKVKFLWTSDMLVSKSPLNIIENDCELLGLTNAYSFLDVKTQFRKSKVYLWLLNTVKSEMYFGELTNALHNSFIDDPKPYRNNVKTLLSNLLNWVDVLNVEDFIIDRPNYSQRIKRL